jgi:hypothetical protein
MIFKTFDPTDVVEGRTTKVASGFWPDGSTYWSSSFFESGFWELVNSQTPSTAYGSSPYDVRKTLYYTDVYPNNTYKNTYKDPYFSIAYGHIGGSGSFDFETGSIKVSPTKAIYNQYKNLLLGNTDIDGKFTFLSASTEINADDIYVINFSTYKTKDRIDEGVFEISLSSADGVGTVITFIDDSFYTGKVQSVYQLVTGSLSSVPRTKPAYQGVGLLYPNDGIVVFNATKLNELLGYERAFIDAQQSPVADNNNSIVNGDGLTVVDPPSGSYYTGSKSNGMVGVGNYTPLNSSSARYNTYLNADLGNQNNTQIFFWSIKHSKKAMVVRKSEYVPSRHYFVRIKNRDFNYSNNPTYVYDGKEITSTGIKPSAGTIRNEDFYTDPRTYITTVGLYNDTNELVAVAKLSRPAVKSFDSELLVKIRLDF